MWLGVDILPKMCKVLVFGPCNQREKEVGRRRGEKTTGNTGYHPLVITKCKWYL